MNNPVDQPKVSELLPCPLCDMHLRPAQNTPMVGMLQHPPHAHCPISALCFTDTPANRAAYLAALPQPQATTVGVKDAWIEWTAFNLIDLGDDELIDVRTVGGDYYPHQPYFNHKQNSSGIIAWRRSALIGIPGAEKGGPVAWRVRWKGDERWTLSFRDESLSAFGDRNPGIETEPLYAAPTSERVQALLATLHQANPTDPSRWHVRPGMHAAFSDAVAALLHEGQG